MKKLLVASVFTALALGLTWQGLTAQGPARTPPVQAPVQIPIHSGQNPVQPGPIPVHAGQAPIQPVKHGHTPHCEPGFRIIEEVVYQDVERTVCRMVPETKKKWVYDWIDDPFCIVDAKHPHHGLLHHGHGHGHGQPGDCGPHCAGPHCRKLLVKRLVDTPCETLKCVTETIVERVPCVVYKKVPCDVVPGMIPQTGTPPTVEQIPVAPKLVTPKQK